MSQHDEPTMGHESWLEAAAAYALDALDSKERSAFEAHAAQCASCRLAVQEYREVAGLLVHASEPVAAPSGLQGRITAMLREEAGSASTSTTTPAIADVISIASRREARSPWGSWSTWVAAASLIIAATMGVLWRRSNDAQQLAQREAAALAREMRNRDSLLSSLQGPRVHVVSLTTPAGGPTVARVFWNHEQHRFIVTAFNVPAAKRGRTYQLWAIAKGHAPVSMGTFNTDASGVANVILPVGTDIEALGVIDVCALTEEPDGGSPQPTETPRLAGGWRHTD